MNGRRTALLCAPPDLSCAAALCSLLSPHILNSLLCYMLGTLPVLLLLLPLLQYNDVCWVGAPKDWEGVDKIFPKGRMTFSGMCVLLCTVTVSLCPKSQVANFP
jgi:hypothetical protein